MPKVSNQSVGSDPHSPSSAIDRTVLAELVGDDTAAIRELLESFISNAHVSFENLSRAINEKDADDFERAAHKLSGSARTAGATAVNDAVEKMRSAVHERNWEGVETAIPVLERALQGVKDYVAKM